MTSRSMTTIRGLAAAVALAACGSAAWASGAANLSFTSFTVSTSAGTLTWLDADSYRTFYAEAQAAGGLADFQSASAAGSETDALSGGAITGASSAVYASSGAPTFALGASALPVLFPLYSPMPNSAYAIGTQSGAFTLSQAGVVTFTIGYTLSLGASGADSALVQAAFDAGNYGSGLDQAASVNYSTDAVPGGFGSYSGTLKVQVAMNGPADLGYYSLDGRAEALAVSAVPEPSTWAMLPAGLLFVFARSRRRSRSAG